MRISREVSIYEKGNNKQRITLFWNWYKKLKVGAKSLTLSTFMPPTILI